MHFKLSNLAFLLYLASVTSSTPIDIQGPTLVDGLQERDLVPGTNKTKITPPIIALSIQEKAAIISTGFDGILAATGIATYIALVIKNMSDEHRCAVKSGHVDGVNYQYSASGRNCDTTSQQKTVNDAVQKAIKFMNSQNVNQACFQLTHGGTWKGLLQLAAGGREIINNKCESVAYDIVI
ncbi:MAG: hypothetical protein Q9186_005084 [Xanthomendoza sp. 1 TL-2023]